jgi:hypothetical protein
MNVITIESDAFEKIMERLKALEEKFTDLNFKANTPLSEKWLDNQEVTQLLNISKRTLQHYRDERKIAFTQIGNKIYYKASDIERLLKKNYYKAGRL